ncbi:MAG: HAMP domain-containing protein, partial [Alphaproteobacteria bacterium]
MSIRLKILVACLCLTAITIASGVLARASQSELGGLAFRLYDDAFMSMSYLRSAQNTLLSVSRDLAAPVTEGLPALDEKMESAVSDLQVAHDRALSPEGAKMATWLQQQVAIVQQQVRSGLPARHSVLSNIEEHFDSAVEIYAGDGFRFRREAVGLIAHVKRQTWVVMAVSVTMALAITVLLSRAIVPSVRYAVGIATNIASGRLDNPIGVTGGGETGVLLRALGTMQRSIADKMAQIERLMAQQASNHATEIAAQHLRFEVAL